MAFEQVTASSVALSIPDLSRAPDYQVLPVPLAAVVADVCERKMRQDIAEGKYAVVRNGRRIGITVGELKRVIAQNTVPAFDAKAAAREMLGN